MILTIGHSTRALDELVSLLTPNGVAQLADIRTVPRSRRHPQFAIDALSVSLPAAGIVYRHFPGLGGLRKPHPNSANSGWQHPAQTRKVPTRCRPRAAKPTARQSRTAGDDGSAERFGCRRLSHTGSASAG